MGLTNNNNIVKRHHSTRKKEVPLLVEELPLSDEEVLVFILDDVLLPEAVNELLTDPVVDVILLHVEISDIFQISILVCTK